MNNNFDIVIVIVIFEIKRNIFKKKSEKVS